MNVRTFSVVAAALLGCTESADPLIRDASVNAPDAASLLDTLHAELLDALVSKSIECWGGTAEHWTHFFERASCQSLPELNILNDGFTLELHPENLAACLTSIGSADCSRIEYPDDLARRCTDLINFAEGSRCVFGAGCTSDTTCIWRDYYDEVCEPVTRIAARGEACGGTVLCDAGLSCWNGFCFEPRALGESCEFAGPCDEDAYCPRMTLPVVCTPRQSLGQSCTNPNTCLAGLHCDRNADNELRCRRRKKIGDACEPGLIECILQAHCSARGVCEPDPLRGEPCAQLTAPPDSPFCQLGLYCDESSVCADVLNIGDSCDESKGQCFYDCREGRCTRLLDIEYEFTCESPRASGDR